MYMYVDSRIYSAPIPVAYDDVFGMDVPVLDGSLWAEGALD